MRRIMLAVATAAAVGLPYLFSAGLEPSGESEAELPTPAAQVRTASDFHGQQSTSSEEASADETHQPEEKPQQERDSSSPSHTPTDNKETSSDQPSKADRMQGSASASGQGPRPLHQPVGVRELFSRYITPQWLRHRWQEVSTVTDEVRLFGYRVAVVTGTEAKDLAGSFTYYFDAWGRLKRIRFRATTGDPWPLVRWLQEEFGLRADPEGALGTWEYRRVEGDRVVSWLRVRPAQVLQAGRPQEHFHLQGQLQWPQRRPWLAPSKHAPPQFRF